MVCKNGSVSKRKEFFTELAEVVAQDSPIVFDVLHTLGPKAQVDAFFIRPETVIDDDSVYDSLSIYVIGDGRLTIIVSDISHEFAKDGEFITTTIDVDLASVRDYQIVRRRVLAGDEAGAYTGLVMRLRWGGGLSIDAIPASCDDPNCMADHGYVGRLSGEDAEIVLDGTVSSETFRKGLVFVGELVAMIRDSRR